MQPIPASVTLQGREVPVRVLEEFGELGPPARTSLQRLLAHPEALDRCCRTALLDPPPGSEEGAVELYVSHHQELALPPEVATSGVEAFVRAMTVRSIWITADDDEELFHVDDTIDARRTQYVLSVALDHDGVARSVRMES